MDPIFVASPTEILRGEEARERIAAANDLRFAVNDNILTVDQERWQAAQDYERATWLDVNPHFISDRNEIHAQGFDHYAALPNMMTRILEIGCGPFTNTRLILEHVIVKQVFLLDPLINAYLNHPNCTYASGLLNGLPINPIPDSIENYQPGRIKFDIVVMINTLPHCYDAETIFEKVPKLIKKGGYLVWAEFPTMPDVALNASYDVGHPLKIRPDRMEAFLTQFQEVYRKGWYFIGTKA